jgi:hypothetical protein
MSDDLTKSAIWNLFYAKQQVVRSGGGKPKMKVGRQTVSAEKIEEFNKLLGSKDTKVAKYYIKLRDRKAGIAPPQMPK